MSEQLSKLVGLLAKVRNPLWALLDRLGMLGQPYVLELRDGYRVQLRPGTGDLYGLYEICVRGDYLSAGQQLQAGATVIDIGANIGCFTIVASKAVGPTGHVYAIEPDESTFQCLQRNIELNGLQNVTALQLAVGGRPGSITLHCDPNRLFSSIFPTVNGRPIGGTDQQVRMVTLDTLMGDLGVGSCSYLKLDCEGAEHEIIAALSPSTARRIAQITMEVHKVPNHNGEDLVRRLQTLGFRRLGTTTLPYYRRDSGMT